MESSQRIVWALETPNAWGEGTGFFESHVEAKIEGIELALIMGTKPQHTYVIVPFEVDDLAWQISSSAEAWISNKAYDQAQEIVWEAYGKKIASDEKLGEKIEELHTMYGKAS